MSHIYQNFCEKKEYNDDLKYCIEQTVQNLFKIDTSEKKPGMLLGKVQSGKTRAFIGVIALAFDQGYDLSVVLTKGTNLLANQTFKRLSEDFKDFVDDDEVKIYDIMQTPDELTPYIRNQKLIFVVKKETNNLDRLAKLFSIYEDFHGKRVLIIDDEADYATIGYKSDKFQKDGFSINTIPVKIDNMRKCVARTSFLQVTATAYSLYLQPETIKINGEEYLPFRPAFTVLVPIHDKYVGGEFYFEESENPDSPAYYIHIDVPEKEIEVLGKKDKRYLNSVLTTENLKVFRQSIINFLVGGSIRILQQHPKKYKCSCIIHTEVSRNKHSWQQEIVESFIKKLRDDIITNQHQIKKLVELGYDDIKKTFLKSDLSINELPSLDDVYECVIKSIQDGHIKVTKINSENETGSLLDDKGQLRLDNPFNIFIGGQILDRGITIENLICFFYGRNPKKFQQDSVLQHSRMYGSRSVHDKSVTRFYTSARIYEAMKKIHYLDSALRDTFEKGQNGNDGVNFLQIDPSGTVIPCSPNKIRSTSTETIIPFRRFLPRGMQTISATQMSAVSKKIDNILNKYNFNNDNLSLISIADAFNILDLINESYVFSEQYDNYDCKWDLVRERAIIKRLCINHIDPERNEKIFCIVKRNRDAARRKSNGVFSDTPDDGQTDRQFVKKIADNLPVLQLFYQNGEKAKGWLGSPFWWPVLVCPGNTKPSVFAQESQ
jgi:hypothetical protein